MIEIKNRYTGATIQSVDNANLRDANLRDADLRGANLCYANLVDADLCGANLRDANLCRANLCYANLVDAGVVVVGIDKWHGCITRTHVHIGCVRVPVGDLLMRDSDGTVGELDADAARWWAVVRGVVLAAIEAVGEEADDE